MRSEPNRFEKWLLRRTHRIWNREISRVISLAFERRVISSSQAHFLAAKVDPTQNHMIRTR